MALGQVLKSSKAGEFAVKLWPVVKDVKNKASSKDTVRLRLNWLWHKLTFVSILV